MSAAKEMLIIKSFLEARGNEVVVPYNVEKYASGEWQNTNQESTEQKIVGDLIRGYFEEIINADAVVIANYDKHGIKNYIGGNSFLEAGFAHVLDKPLYFVNAIPELSYQDELIAMQPIMLNGDLNNIR